MIEQQNSQQFLKKRNPSAQITTTTNRRHFRSSAGSRDAHRKQKVTASMHITNNHKLNLTTVSKNPDSMHFQYVKKNPSVLSKVQRYKTNDSFIGHSSLQKNKNISGTTIKDYRRKILRKNVLSSVKIKNRQAIFLRKVEQLQSQFIQFCLKQHYEQAIKILVNLINYTIDLNLSTYFSMALKILAGFYFFIQNFQQALFYFNQSRYCGLLLSHNSILIESLISMSKCCSKADLEEQSISILKKALQYSWLFDKKEHQLLIYDEIGKKYYRMGKVDIAKKYHLRYINSQYQPSTSALKNLSKQRILKNLQIYCHMRYNQLDTLFLAHLKIPIKKTNELAPIITQNEIYVRNKMNINQKYFEKHNGLQNEVKKMLQNWFFQNQIDDPNLPNEDWTLPIKLKKFTFIDFKLNQKLKEFKGKVKEKKVDCKRKGVQYKESIEEKVMNKLKEPALQDDWFEKIASQIKRDHQNKLSQVRDPVRLKGNNKSKKPSIELAKQLYNYHFTHMDF